MFDGYDDFAFCGYGDNGRVDRGCWAEKSVAASKREDQARQRLDEWISSCQNEQTFPIENPELVPAGIHLTNPCWLSFRKYAIAKGLQVGRREATPEERAASGDKRRGKLYVIWAKLPVHPSQAVEFSESKQQQAKEGSAKRKQQEQKRKEELERQEQAKRQKVVTAYHNILQQEQHTPVHVPSHAASLPPVQAAASINSVPPPTPQDILAYTDEAYKKELLDIRSSINEERRAFEEKIKKKQKALEVEALQLSKKIKASVLSSLPSEKECSNCKKKCKLLVAECTGCQVQWCAECLVQKVNNEHKCYLCVESWLGKKPNASDESSIRQDSKHGLAKFCCLQCPSTKRGWEVGLEYTRCCEEYVCQDHLLNHNCCVCSGSRPLCVQCGIGRCGRCGRELCSTCSYKEGCMCEDTSARPSWC
jgi:hypothetical protein